MKPEHDPAIHGYKSPEVRTARLRISPYCLEALRELRARETDPEMRKAYADMEREMLSLPGREEWGAEWNIQLLDGQTIGGICFKGAPDKSGSVELGYGIHEAFRRRGYAAEAVGGMAAWALAQKGVRTVTAQTEPGNHISQRVLLRNGFVRDGDGPEGPLFRLNVTQM